MSQRQSAFGHHFHVISEVELVSSMPAYAPNDDLPVEMAPFEKIIGAQHRGQPHSCRLLTTKYAPLSSFAPAVRNAERIRFRMLTVSSDERDSSCVIGDSS
jgi:hypothetical protein